MTKLKIYTPKGFKKNGSGTDYGKVTLKALSRKFKKNDNS